MEDFEEDEEGDKEEYEVECFHFELFGVRIWRRKMETYI